MNNETLKDNEVFDVNSLIASFLILPFSIAAFVLNIVSLCILKRSKKLRQNTYHRLTLSLSISNVIASFTSCVLLISGILQYFIISIPYICYIGLLFSSVSFQVSLTQVLLICTNRLVATCLILGKSRKWNFLFQFVSVVLFTVSVLYTIVLHVLYAKVESTSCKLINIFRNNYDSFLGRISWVRLVVFIGILIIYTIVFRRLKGRFDQNMKYTVPRDIGRAISERCQQDCNSSVNVIVDCNDPPDTPKLQCIEMNQIGLKNDNTRQTGQILPTSSKSCHQDKKRNPLNVSPHIKNYRNAVITLGVVIASIGLTGLPSVFVSLIWILTERIVSVKVLEFTHGLVVLNSLFDPVIYVLTIKEFRKTIFTQRRKIP